ncbi:trigger factor [Gloeomargarita sp.]
MKITQEPLPKSQLGLRVEIPAEEVAKQHETVFRRLLKNVRLPGFRQGKVPPHILRQYLGEATIRGAVVEELVETAMPKALQQIGVPTIGEPELREEMATLVQRFHPQQPFVFEMAVDVWPEVTLGDYRSLAVRAVRYEADPEQVERTLRQQQYRHATLVPVERPAQAGDVAIIDVEAYRQTDQGRGEPVEFFRSREMEVRLDPEDGEYYKEVLTALVGMQVGETKEITLTTDDGGWPADLANQTFLLVVTLKELKEPELPPLDDEFAQKVSDCQTIAELRQRLAERYRRQAEHRTQQSLERGISDALLAITTTEVPRTLLARNLRSLFEEAVQSLAQQGADLDEWLTQEQVQAMGEELLPVAERRVKTVLALKAIAEREGLHPDEAAIQARIEEIRRTEPELAVSPSELRRMAEQTLRPKLALQWLQERAQITWITQEQAIQELLARTEQSSATGEGESAAAATVPGESATSAETSTVAATVTSESTTVGQGEPTTVTPAAGVSGEASAPVAATAPEPPA